MIAIIAMMLVGGTAILVASKREYATEKQK